MLVVRSIHLSPKSQTRPKRKIPRVLQEYLASNKYFISIAQIKNHWSGNAHTETEYYTNKQETKQYSGLTAVEPEPTFPFMAGTIAEIESGQ
jgi:hypothetical protein